MPEMLDYVQMLARVEKGKASALLDMRKRKDWSNSTLYQNSVLLEQESGPLDTIDSAASATISPQKKDGMILSANEVEYLSKVFCQQLSMKALNSVEDGDEEENDDSEAEVWTKALATESLLKDEVALHRRLPKEVWKTHSLRNLIKVLLRIKKLYGARTSALRILKTLTAFKNATRGEVANLEELFKQAIALRSSLLEFRQEYKIFGAEFLFEDIDLCAAFEAI